MGMGIFRVHASRTVGTANVGDAVNFVWRAQFLQQENEARGAGAGMVVKGQEGMDVGDRVTLTLLSADPVRGFIDFGRP